MASSTLNVEDKESQQKIEFINSALKYYVTYVDTKKTIAEAKDSTEFATFLVKYKTAYDFYSNNGFNAAAIPSHLNGIDFTKDVTLTKTSESSVLYQFQLQGAWQGCYYSPALLDPSSLGIADKAQHWSENTIKDKLPHVYTTVKCVDALQSTAASIEDTWSQPGKKIKTTGGALQLFCPQKDAFTFKEILPPYTAKLSPENYQIERPTL